MQPNNHITRCLPKSNENLYSHKNLNANVYSIFICNHQKLDTNQMILNWWMNKQNEVYIHAMKHHSAKKKKEQTTNRSSNMDKIQNALC